MPDAKPRVLIVDDEPYARDLLEGFLLEEGYNLTFAENGAQALQALDRITNQPPDLILLDVMMPEIDGFTICRQLKAHPQWRHIPIILITALGGKEDLARGLEAGADDFLHKPVDDLELKARVHSMLRIKKQYDKLQASLRLREDLAHMIVHDMRTPITAIMGYSSLLQATSNMPAEALEEIDKIHTQVQRLNLFLNDMLMIAKMEEAGQLVLNRSPVDLNQLIQWVENNHQVVTRLKRINLVNKMPSKSPQLLLDANLFRRVLDNLISNALKFSPPQSTVTVRVEELAENREPRLRIQVIDQGPGIPEAYRERIFKKFEIAKLREKDVHQIGLGLVLCKVAVEAHGGSIFVEDNQPTGSIFTVEI